PVGPNMGAVRCVDQLSGYAHPVAGFAEASLEHVTHAKLAPDLTQIRRPAFVSKARIARDDEEPRQSRDRRNDLLDDTVDKIFLIRTASNIGEGQDRDRRLVGQCQWSRRRYHRFRGSESPDMHWASDVLDLLLAQILKSEVKFVAHLVAHHSAHPNLAELGKR